jgi:hypothetical protein
VFSFRYLEDSTHADGQNADTDGARASDNRIKNEEQAQTPCPEKPVRWNATQLRSRVNPDQR